MLKVITLIAILIPVHSYAWGIFNNCFNNLEKSAAKFALCHQVALYSDSCEDESIELQIAELNCKKDNKSYSQIDASKRAAFLKQGYDASTKLSPYEKLKHSFNNRAPFYSPLERENIYPFDPIVCHVIEGKFFKNIARIPVKNSIYHDAIYHLFFYPIPQNCLPIDSIESDFPILTQTQVESLKQNDKVFVYLSESYDSAANAFHNKEKMIPIFITAGTEGNIKILNIKEKYKYGMLLPPGKYQISWYSVEINPDIRSSQLFIKKQKNKWIELKEGDSEFKLFLP